MPPISPERWRALSPYLDEALEISAAERPAWLAAIVARDAVLGRELQAMLAEHEVADHDGFLAGAVVDPRLSAAPSLAGQVLGAYRLVSLIGQGGSGSVWLAERCDGRFEGRAAVKLLNVALINRAGEERFRREGTILARLRHPQIAHLVDAGVSRSGQPYLVLEHVDGQAIDHYCDVRTLGIDARVRLFLDVLAAVAHAHTNLIVHRDIKPANVLVSVDGAVKLLDFGIAKLIEPGGDWEVRATEGSPLTHEVGRSLTPEFAAPEQLAGGPVTTATDIYSLGVLLYVLLSGHHPAGRAVRSPATLIRSIVDTEPGRLSDAVVAPSDLGDDPATHAAHCGTTPHRLQRTLRGDLDTIVAKTLKKDAAERYASVTALADDLRRYLRHEPISARPDSVRYRAARFMRRHALGVSSVVGMILLVGGLTAYHTTRLSAERDRAQRETAKAVKVSELLMQFLSNADPFAIRTQSGEPSVRALLNAGAEQVQKDLVNEPELQAEMLTMMGRTYRRLGEFDKAQALLEQALASGRKAYGAEHAQVAQALEYLGVVQADKGDYGSAARSLEQALAMRRTVLGRDHADVAITLAELGRIYQDEGDGARAEPLHREALQIRRTALGDEHRETAVSLSDLASVLRLAGDFASAEILLRECLEINRKTRGPEHANTAVSLHDLALIAAARGDLNGAEFQLRQSLGMLQKALGERHPVVAPALNSLAHVLSWQGRHDEAAAVMQHALDNIRPSLGANHQTVAIYTLTLGAIHMARRQPRLAEPLFREGLGVRALAPTVVPSRRRTVRDDDWSLAATKSALAGALMAQARFADAEPLLLDARRELDLSSSARADDIKVTTSRLIDLYSDWGKQEQAAAWRARPAY